MLFPVSAAAAQDGGRPITVQMTGPAERPGPGDPDGAGTATFRINPGQCEVCYTLTVRDIEAAPLAHFHRAPPTSAGPIQTPDAFYVNVHNTPYPAGAVRGQLGR